MARRFLGLDVGKTGAKRKDIVSLYDKDFDIIDSVRATFA